MKRISLFLTGVLLSVTTARSEDYYRLITGSYTGDTAGTGIHTYAINCETGEARLLSTTEDIINTSYLAFSPDGHFVYAVSEHGRASQIYAFTFDTKSGHLHLLNSAVAPGADPCYLSVTDKHVITADYSGGSISVFGRKDDGSLTEALQVIHHTGSSIDAARQGEPHVHQTVFTPDGTYLLVNDLGTDRVTVYRYHSDVQENILTTVDSLTTKRGGGPRHLAIRPARDASTRTYIVCVLHELDGTVSTLSVDANGRLQLLHETSIVRRDDVRTGAADIHFSPDGKFLYATNRGTANDITCFAANGDGSLTFVQQIPSGGAGPRSFALTPDGKYVFTANQQTGNIAIFARNAETGMLVDSKMQIEVKRAVCVLFY
jgi:6-phosphogluconolactonase